MVKNSTKNMDKSAGSKENKIIFKIVLRAKKIHAVK
jgi:hypothetical protein